MNNIRKEINLHDPSIISQVWEKGLVIDGYNPNLYRQDFGGAWIAREEYGNVNSMLGWEIDHVYPISKGGNDAFDNLRPMNWRNNRSKGDSFPDYIASVTSEENRNIEKEVKCRVNDSLLDKLNKLYNG